MQNLSVILCGMALIILAAGAVSAQTMINDVSDLQNMQSDLTGDYVLAGDIDATTTSTWNGGEGFIPVGSSGDPFTGSFDGAGYAITGLYINRQGSEYCGLFGAVDDAMISNVTLAGVNITCGGLTGGLAGEIRNSTSVTNCHVTGNVSISRFMTVGGLVGNMWPFTTLSECSANCTVTASANVVGGLVGAIGGSVFNCYASGAVSGMDVIGGLAGTVEMMGGVINCYSSAAVSDSGSAMFIGGLIGMAGGIEIPPVNKGAGDDDGFTPIVPDRSTSIKNDIEIPILLINTYWDTDSSGQASSAGEAPGACEGKTTTEMMAQATFENWDFTSIWSICEGTTYPFLQASPKPPVEVTINQGSAQTDPANTLSIVFDVVFTAPVTGFDDGDVDFSGSAGVTTYTVTDTGDSMNFTVEVKGVAADGTIIASVPAAVAADACSMADNNVSTSTDNTVSYDQTSPSVAITSVDPAAARDGVTVTVEVTASDAGSGLDGVPSVTLNSHAMTHQDTVGDVYTYTLTLGAGSTEGPATIVAAVDDLAGNPGSDTDTTSLTIDNTPPEVNIGAPEPAEVNTGGTVEFTIGYTGASSCSLTESDITLDVTGDVTASVAVAGTGCTYTVTLSNFAGEGSAGFTIAANTAEDEAGNMAPSASTPTPVTVTSADTTPPVIDTCPEDISEEAAPDNEIPDVTGDVEARDEVTASENLIITQDPEAGTPVGPGDHIITIFVKDEAGNINDSCTVTFSVSTYHPADINEDNQISMYEAITYVYGWQSGANDENFAVRVLLLWQHGEGYRYDPSITSLPECWVSD